MHERWATHFAGSKTVFDDLLRGHDMLGREHFRDARQQWSVVFASAASYAPSSRFSRGLAPFRRFLLNIWHLRVLDFLEVS